MPLLFWLELKVIVLAINAMIFNESNLNWENLLL